VDDACILDVADYPPYLTQLTTVTYSRYQIGTLLGMEFLINSGKFIPMPPIPASTLQKNHCGRTFIARAAKTGKRNAAAFKLGH
jgi:hypothetical protein